MPTRHRRGISRQRSDAGPRPGHGLVLRGEVDGRGRGRGGDISAEAGRNKDGTAARADGRRVRRRDRHVVLRLERAQVRARQVRQRDIRRGDVEVLVARRVGDERVDNEECPVTWLTLAGLGRRDGTGLVRVTRAERAETPVSLYGGERRIVRVVGRVDRVANSFGDGTSMQLSEDFVVGGVYRSFVKGEEDQITVVVEVGVAAISDRPTGSQSRWWCRSHRQPPCVSRTFTEGGPKH